MKRGRHVVTHTFTGVWPILDAGYDMPQHALRAQAERELPDLLFDLHAVPCGEPRWTVEPFRSSPVGVALVVRVAAREWPAELAALDVRESRA